MTNTTTTTTTTTKRGSAGVGATRSKASAPVPAPVPVIREPIQETQKQAVVTPPTPPTTPTPEPVQPVQPVAVTPIAPSQYIALERSNTLRLITQTMRNGAVSTQPGERTFAPHVGLMQKLRAAYDKGDSEAFISIVQSYLQQAVRSLPHAGLPQEIPGKIQGLRTLIEQVGLPLVGQRILAWVHA